MADCKIAKIFHSSVHLCHLDFALDFATPPIKGQRLFPLYRESVWFCGLVCQSQV